MSEITAIDHVPVNFTNDEGVEIVGASLTIWAGDRVYQCFAKGFADSDLKLLTQASKDGIKLLPSFDFKKGKKPRLISIDFIKDGKRRPLWKSPARSKSTTISFG